ncbi:QueT transporter family protein [Lactobacillus selangorensis]|nr:QueT transporter family protein [Lactobacillus selangorensis]
MNEQSHQRITVQSLTKSAIVTALYVVVTLMLSALSFGAIQIRLAEMFNYMAIENKRYVYAVTLGVAISNAISSPMGIVDVLWGSFSTFVTLWICRLAVRHVHNQILRLVITGAIVVFSMCTIAGELALVSHINFWWTWLTIAAGEAVSMAIGGVLIYFVGKRVDLTA